MSWTSRDLFIKEEVCGEVEEFCNSVSNKISVGVYTTCIYSFVTFYRSWYEPYVIQELWVLKKKEERLVISWKKIKRHYRLSLFYSRFLPTSHLLLLFYLLLTFFFIGWSTVSWQYFIYIGKKTHETYVDKKFRCSVRLIQLV